MLARTLLRASAAHGELRVGVAGGGISGCLLASQLAREPGVRVTVYERRARGALPPGLSLLLSHNGMAALADADAALAAEVRRRGVGKLGWKARTMTGELLYDIPDVQSEGLADAPGVVARWDEVAAAMQEACAGVSVRWETVVEGFSYREGGGGEVVAARLRAQDGAGSAEAEDELDLLVACDGRYSSVRRALGGGELPEPCFGPPYIADFRLVVPDTSGGLVDGMERVYNTPDLRLVEEGGPLAHLAAAEPAFASTCMAGLVRVGLGRVLDGAGRSLVGIFGNVCMPGGGAPIPAAARTAEGLRALYTPPEGEAALDGLGRFVLESLTRHADELYWARKQEVPPLYRDVRGRVLLIGDSAGAVYPSLAQGATLAIEDACAAAAVLRAYVRPSGEHRRSSVPEATRLLEELRAPRRAEVAAASRAHAAHVGRGGRAALAAEAADWLGTGASGAEAPGAWRARLRNLWRGWPRQADCAAAAEQQAAFWLAPQVGADGQLQAVFASPEAFRPFGQLVTPVEDGEEFCAGDAQLDGLANGTPRFYLMRLRGPRPLQFARITHHRLVTQCLGSVGGDEAFYLAVHAPTPEGVPATLDGVRAFLIPPRTFVKLHRGTWHAGPLWGDAPERLFYNLELHDTNVSDHHSITLKHSARPDGLIQIVPPGDAE